MFLYKVLSASYWVESGTDGVFCNSLQFLFYITVIRIMILNDMIFCAVWAIKVIELNLYIFISTDFLSDKYCT